MVSYALLKPKEIPIHLFFFWIKCTLGCDVTLTGTIIKLENGLALRYSERNNYYWWMLYMVPLKFYHLRW